jgi:hypothetical protein
MIRDKQFCLCFCLFRATGKFPKATLDMSLVKDGRRGEVGSAGAADSGSENRSD